MGLGNIVDALACLRVLFDRDGVRLGIVKGGEGELKVLNVLVGPSSFAWMRRRVSVMPHIYAHHVFSPTCCVMRRGIAARQGNTRGGAFYPVCALSDWRVSWLRVPPTPIMKPATT